MFSSAGCGPRSKRDLEISAGAEAGLCCRPGKLLHPRDELPVLSRRKRRELGK